MQDLPQDQHASSPAVTSADATVHTPAVPTAQAVPTAAAQAVPPAVPAELGCQEIDSCDPKNSIAAEITPRSDSPKYRRLSVEERKRILQLRQADTPYKEIARLVNRSPATIYEYLQPYESTADQAIGLLRAGAETAARSWLASMSPAAADGNHRPAKDLLVAVGVVTEQPQTAIAVQVNVPGSALPAALSDRELGESPIDNFGQTR